MRRYEGRLAKLEQARPQCKGVYRIAIFRCRRGFEDRLPPADNNCLACGKEHEPAAGSNPVRRVIITVPGSREDEPIAPEGWRHETENGR
jgi:hypothetical protein